MKTKVGLRILTGWVLMLAGWPIPGAHASPLIPPGAVWNLPVVSVSATDPHARETGPLSQIEGIDAGRFTFHRSGPVDSTLTVSFTLSGSAINGDDYVALTDQVVFATGAATTSLEVIPINDALVETTESVVVTLPTPACASEVPPQAGCYRVEGSAQAEVAIHDYLAEPPNHAPFIQLNEPQNGAVFNVPADIRLAAYAQDPESGHEVQVEFFEGDHSLGLGTFVPSLCPAPFCPFYTLTWSNAPLGTYIITARATDSAGASTVSAPVNVIVREEPSGQRELHVIGIYSGVTSAGSYSHNHEQGNAAVAVNRPGQRVTLFLSAYEPVLWHVTATEGTTIERVILSGYYRQAVEGLGPDVQITFMSYEERTGYVLAGYTVDSGAFYRAVPKINQLTGLEISSFHGGYIASYPEPFHLDSVQDDPRLGSDYPQPVPPSELPALTFQISFFPAGPAGQVTTRTYSLAGPQDGGALLPSMRVVPDAGGRFYYGTESHTVWKVDSQSGTAEEQILPSELPELSWPMGMAFDTQRGRVLLVSLGGEGFLYSYAASPAQWSLVASMDNHDLDCLEYHARQDALYGLSVVFGDGGGPRLEQYNAAGIFQSHLQLPVQPFMSGISQRGAEIISVGDYLVVLFESGTHYPDQRSEARMYLVDPRTGEFWLTYRQVGASQNQAPSVHLVSPAEGMTFPPGSSISLEAAASDPDGTVSTVEFFANGQPIGSGHAEGGSLFRLEWAGALPGQHVLMARATDNRGATTSSASVRVRVEEGGSGTPVTLVQAGSVWKYLADGSDQGTAWREPSFDDSVWVSGPAQLGYGDGDETTVVSFGPDPATKHITTYFRHSFTVQNAAGASDLFLRLLRDDGARVFLNGMEVFRSNLPDGPVSFNTLALAAVGGEQERTEFLEAPADPSLLREGANVLAVEIHQASVTSSDISFDLSLAAEGNLSGGDLPSLNFQLTFYNGHVLFTKDYTLAGPADGQRLLPAMRIVADGGGQHFYGTEGQAVFRIDAATSTSQEMVQPPLLAAEGWPMGLTYDPVRHQVRVVSLGGEGFLHAYSPAHDEWSLISSMDNLDLDCLEYHAPSDSLYGIQVTWGGGSGSIYELSPAGAVRRQIPLPVLPFAISPGGYQSELVSVGEYLVLLVEPQYSWQASGESRIYVIDPRTGRSWLTYRRERIPENHPPQVTLLEPADGDTFPSGANIEIAAEAVDPDTSVAQVEFFAGSERIGLATEPTSGLFRLTWSDVPQGHYTLTARAIDPAGAVGISAPVHITVGMAVSIRAIDAQAAEQDSDPAVFQVTRTSVTDEPLLVFYRDNGTATENLDYEALPGVVEIPAGAASAEIILRPVDDDLGEATENVGISLILPPLTPGGFGFLPTPDPDLAGFPPPAQPYLIHNPSFARAFIADNDGGPPPQPPEVLIINPRNGAAFPEGENIQLTATAFDRDDQVISVKFVANDNLIGFAQGPLFSPIAGAPFGPIWLLTWTNVVAGEYSLTAIASDQLGLMSTSAPVQIRVTESRPVPEVIIRVTLQPQTIEDIRLRGICVALNGVTSGTCVLERSTDLVNWTPLLTRSVTAADCEMFDRSEFADATMRFYRVRMMPPP